MSREEHEDLNKIQSFLSNLDGIQVFVISRDGFPIIFGRELDQESAEAYTALSVDLILASQEALKDINEHGSKNIIVELDKNIVINVHQLNSILLTIKGDRRIVPITDKNILNYINKNNIKCPYCGYELTLEVYKCPKCGKRIPFTSSTCPYCGYNVNIKQCPKCKKLISSDGRKVKLVRSREARELSILEGLTAAVATGAVSFILSNSVPVGAITGLIAGGIVAYLIYSRAGLEYKIED